MVLHLTQVVWLTECFPELWDLDKQVSLCII